MDLNDTIVALASAPGSGARAVVRLSGPRAIEIAQTVFSPTVDPTQCRLHRGEIRLHNITAPLPADMIVWPAPRTYTGQPMAELHTVSSPPLNELLITALLNAGARAARPGEFTMRAFLAGKRDLLRAEAVQAVIAASNRDELKQALGQLAGGMTRPLAGVRDDLLNLLADVEAGLDFTDEDISFVDKTDVLLRLTAGMARLTTLKRQLDQRSAGERPFRAALVGEPNAGKSSLFNALGGSALVSAEPGTTRDYVSKRLDLGGVIVELIDTAGWQSAEDAIGEQSQSLAAEQARDADLLLVCSERGTFYFSGKVECPLYVATKVDVNAPPEGVLATSAVTGEGLDELKAQLAEHAHRRQPALAPSLSRCRHHVDAALEALRRAHATTLFDDPPEVLALELRGALDQLGAMTGDVHTDDLLDRIFSRFCIGK